MTPRHTRVGIVGAGPAGLILAHLLRLRGIASVVLESRSRGYVESRIRAGVLEHGTVQMLTKAGLADRLHREALQHHGLILRFSGADHRIDLTGLTGKQVTVYAQHELVKDLIASWLAEGGDIRFDAEALAVADIDGFRPRIRYRRDGAEHELACDFIAGCDGFHGICRDAIPAAARQVFEQVYPFGWLGILAEVRPSSPELVYANHENGFSLLSMRSPAISRLYLQCAPDEDIANWSDDRIWAELHTRLAADGFALTEGRIIQKAITPMRSFVNEPMQWKKMFLLGDAAHIVPPTGAKGLNLAAGDAMILARALAGFYADGATAKLDAYTATCLRRVWKVQRFSWWMTSLLHRFDRHSKFERRVQLAELDYLTTSPAAATALAENYVGLALE